MGPQWSCLWASIDAHGCSWVFVWTAMTPKDFHRACLYFLHDVVPLNLALSQQFCICMSWWELQPGAAVAPRRDVCGHSWMFMGVCLHRSITKRLLQCLCVCFACCCAFEPGTKAAILHLHVLVGAAAWSSSGSSVEMFVGVCGCSWVFVCTGTTTKDFHKL